MISTVNYSSTTMISTVNYSSNTMISTVNYSSIYYYDKYSKLYIVLLL